MNPQQQNALNTVNNMGDVGEASSTQPSLLTKLLPTAFSIGGGALGTLLDPVTAGLGTIGGSAAGSALGQYLENKITGGNQSVLGAAGEGAIGGAVGKGISALGKAGAGALIAKGESQAAEQAAADTVNPWSVVPKGVRQAHDFNSTADAFKGYGLEFTPGIAGQTADQVTGSNGVVADLVRSAMEGHDSPVDLTGTRALANQIAGSPELATAGPTVGKTFNNSINSLLGLDQRAGAEAGTINNVSASDVYQARQALQTLAYKKGLNPSLSSAYKSLGQSLDAALSRSGVDATASAQGLSPEQLQTLTIISPKLAGEVQDAANTSVGALRSVQRPFVNAANLSRAHADYSEGILGDQAPTATPTPAPGGGGLLGKIMGGNMSGAEMLGGIGEATVGGHPGIGLPLLGAGALQRYIAQNPLSAGQVLGRLTNAANGAIPATIAQTAAHLPTSGAPVTGAEGDTMAGNYQTAPEAAGPSQAWAALFAPQLVPGLQKAAAAQPLLNSAESAFGNAGGAQGTSGILAALSALIPGTQAYQYNQAKQQLAQQLAQATGSSPQSILAALPSLMGSPEGAQNNFGGIQGQVANLANINPSAGSLGGGSVLAGVH